MSSYFNLGTEETPRWINLEGGSVTYSKTAKSPGKSEVHFLGNRGKSEVVRGEAADKLLAQLAADDELKKPAGV